MASVERDWWDKYIVADELSREKLTKDLLDYSLHHVLPEDEVKRETIVRLVDSYFQDLATMIEELRGKQDDVGIITDSRRVYYCCKCDRYTDVNYPLDKQSNRSKSKCYLCGEEVLEPVEIKRLGVL